MSKSEKRIYNNKIRRELERRKNIFLIFLTVCLTLTLSLSVSSFLSNAKTERQKTMTKCYKSILIESGDTLWAIAAEYKAPDTRTIDFVEELKIMNGLPNDCITAGNFLIIPYYIEES